MISKIIAPPFHYYLERGIAFEGYRIYYLHPNIQENYLFAYLFFQTGTSLVLLKNRERKLLFLNHYIIRKKELLETNIEEINRLIKDASSINDVHQIIDFFIEL